MGLSIDGLTTLGVVELDGRQMGPQKHIRSNTYGLSLGTGRLGGGDGASGRSGVEHRKSRTC